MLYLFDLFGVLTFAMSAAIRSRDKKLDGYGVFVLAAVTSVGGGTLRDLILGRTPVFWVRDPTYVYVIIGAVLLTALLGRLRLLPRRALLVADAFGLAIATIIGTQRAMEIGADIAICLTMGVMTGTTGGIIRDLLTREVPLVLRREIYAVASLTGALVFFGLSMWFQVAFDVAAVASVTTTFGLRMAAIRWNWQLPNPVPQITPPNR
jgi:uncharacterized membrane protein YeiH